MRLPFKPLTATQYQKSILIATILLSIIIMTGAGVRLSEAGLGCEDWPTCNEDKLVPEAELAGWIEFGNRLISGAVAAAVIVNISNAYRRTPRSAVIQRWAWGLVVGVVAQIVLGGITVIFHLHPAVVGLHFLLSLVLLWNCVVLWHRNAPDTLSGIPRSTASRSSLKTHARFLVAAVTLVACTGVLVTGTGPNSGDSRATRLPLDLQWVVRIHSVAVWTFLALLLWLAFRARRHARLTKRTYILMAVAIAQGAIGYTQYFLGVPPALVALHIAGSIAVWITTLDLYFHLVHPQTPHTVERHDVDTMDKE